MFCAGTTGLSAKPVKSERSQVIDANVPEFDGIIGNSHLLLNVFDHVARVAPFDTTVLITGESGTGKERIADCIHDLSLRKGRPLIKLNCAAIPATLIESEKRDHSPELRTGKSASLNKQTGELFFWMRSAKCLLSCR
jgi:transcriptional regulator with GAF, ATPase, and Fis domain